MNKIYVVGISDFSDNAIRVIREQNRFNRRVALFALSGFAFAAIVALNDRYVKNEIENLNSELEELRRSKGE
ncbi:hypothetical protein FACS189499_04920 [Clostridia bacterium]|nr:hypothetical protein FACS189499_04920 [Clostridia bacterium]